MTWQVRDQLAWFKLGNNGKKSIYQSVVVDYNAFTRGSLTARMPRTGLDLCGAVCVCVCARVCDGLVDRFAGDRSIF